MNVRKIFSKSGLVALIALSITACKKDKEDIVPNPSISGLEVGYEDSKIVNRGTDLHLDAEILAPGNIATVRLEISPESSGGWHFEKTYTEGFVGVKNADFHEHVDIPADATTGNYRLRLVVTDQSGNTAAAESALKIVAKNPTAALVFTKITGSESLYPHGDHFHGLGGATEGASDTVTFDDGGIALSNGHLHLEATGFYKIALKTYNAEGGEMQEQYISNAATAANYKAFLIGGSFVLNANTANETGAIFQPRETIYADGTAVTGGATFTTGVTTYFTAGTANTGAKDVTFVMRKLQADIKASITRSDWNREDYTTVFAGTNELELKFEIHAE